MYAMRKGRETGKVGKCVVGGGLRPVPGPGIGEVSRKRRSGSLFYSNTYWFGRFLMDRNPIPVRRVLLPSKVPPQPLQTMAKITLSSELPPHDPEGWLWFYNKRGRNKLKKTRFDAHPQNRMFTRVIQLVLSHRVAHKISIRSCT